MVLATGATQDPSAASILLKTTTTSVSSASFTQQLAAALEQYLGQSKTGANLEIDIAPAQSQNPGASQFLVTVKSASPAPAVPAPAVQSSALSSMPFIQSAPVLAKAAPAERSGSTIPPATPIDAGSNNTSGAATTPAPSGYENVPFGSGFTTVPGLDMELASMNKQSSILAQINPDALSTTAAAAGDPMAGATVPNTNLKWNDLTQNQQLAYQHAELCGLPAGQSMSQFLANYVGPSTWWNASYSNPNMFGAPPASGSVNMYNSPYIDMNG
jgi:hypothetical protein